MLEADEGSYDGLNAETRCLLVYTAQTRVCCLLIEILLGLEVYRTFKKYFGLLSLFIV